tara:strand:- start:3022 stop:3987 length:966 start_codon:yes stop_codon:yes gene_type:complete
MFDKFFWLKPIYEKVNYKNLSHGLIINGPYGIGKRELANEVIKNLLINKIDHEKNLQLINSGNHPDLFNLDKEVIKLHHITYRKNKWDEEKGTKNVNDFINLTPSIAKNKVVLINNAETMNNESQNALLKTLEEPSLNSYILLITNRHHSLEKTIYSRCQIINIPNLSVSQKNKWLTENGLSEINAFNFPSYYSPLKILNELDNGTQNNFKDFVFTVKQFLLNDISQSEAIRIIKNLDIGLIQILNFTVEFLKIILKSKVSNERLSGNYEFLNNMSFSSLKLSNVLNDINVLRQKFFKVSSLNDLHILNQNLISIKGSINN